MMILSLWFRTSNKFVGQEFEEIHRNNIELLETPRQVRIPPSTKYCNRSKKSVLVVQHSASDAVW